MTRARCAECGAVLATERSFSGDDVELHVHPCGACMETAAAYALDVYMERLAEQKELLDERRD